MRSARAEKSGVEHTHDEQRDYSSHRDRESVHAGDDTDSHQEIWDFPFDASLDDLLVNLCSKYLASVAGDIMWVVYLGGGRLPGPRQVLALIYVDYPSWLFASRASGQATKGSRAYAICTAPNQNCRSSSTTHPAALACA